MEVCKVDLEMIAVALFAISEILHDVAPGHTVALDDISEAVATLREAVAPTKPQ